MIRTVGMHHPSFRVSDPERSRRFDRDVLDMVVLVDQSPEVVQSAFHV